MALIIKGDMPSCCAVCCDCNSANDGNFCNRTGNRLGNDWQLHRPLNCPILGEISDEHGRWIDADALISDIENTFFDCLDDYRTTIRVINEAPSMLEAME